MFENNARQEMAIRSPYVKQSQTEIRRRGLSLIARIRQYARGAHKVFACTPHLDRKMRKCYPRGPAFEAMLELIDR